MVGATVVMMLPLCSYLWCYELVLSCVRPYRGVIFMRCRVPTCAVRGAVNVMRSERFWTSR